MNRFLAVTAILCALTACARHPPLYRNKPVSLPNQPYNSNGKFIPKPVMPEEATPEPAKQPSTHGVVTKAVKEKSQASLKTHGLAEPDLVTKIFEGDFVNINIEPTDYRFSILFDSYLKAFAHHCSASLPRNKVQMTEQQCARSMVTRNGFGAEISRECLDYVTVGTGFAKPELYSALKSVNAQRVADPNRQLDKVINMIKDDTAMPKLMGLMVDTVKLPNDMNALVQINSCKSPALMRFEDNLRLFALNKQPIR